MVVCVGTVVLKDESVLFVRQAQGHALAGQWSVPWGLVDVGESPEDAALRETLEESGIRAEIDGLLGIQDLPSEAWLGLAFLCHHVAGEPMPDGTETDAAAWLSREEIDASEEPVEPWCAWLARRVLDGKYTLIRSAPDNPYYPRAAYL
jgi:ADP-ribose pyrophosphatase YjhB (NUDIX family)